MPNYVVVDTDLFSCAWTGRPQAAPFRAELANSAPVLPFTCVAEAYFGAYKANWGPARITKMEAAMNLYIIAPYTPDLAKLWGDLRAKAMANGHALGAKEQYNDLWVAATAIFHDVPLLTLNRKHFEGMPGLKLSASGPEPEGDPEPKPGGEGSG